MSKPRRTRRFRNFVATLIAAIWMLLLFELGSFAVLNYYVYPKDTSAFYERMSRN